MVFCGALWVCSLLLSLGLPAAKAQLPVTPSNDPFYEPPAGYENEAPGAILRNRTINASFLGLIPDLGVEGYQLLYRTTAINGSAIAGATTIFKPVNATTDRFVSFHTAYDGSSTICDPSYNYQLGAPQVDLISSFEMLLLQGYLLAGYIVSSPDYEGPEAAFPVGRLEGMVALDSMRAVTKFKDTLGLSTDKPKIVGYGYSGGSVATGWAASLHQAYAPELLVKGWASGGTVANLTGTLEYLDGTTFAGFLPAAVVGLAKPSAYGAQIQPLIESIVTPYGQSILDFASTYCGAEDIITFAGGSVLSTKFQSEGENLPYNPIIAPVLGQTILGAYKNETPTAPVYMYHASQDEIIPYLNATTLRDTWCEDGASVEFVTYANGGHLTTEVLGFVGAFQFTEAAFSGTTSAGCSSTTTLNNTLDPIALGVELEPVLTGLITALLKLGNGDSNVKTNLSTLKDKVPS